ncbi:hypothetical protein ACJX0J_040789, partial [Zea mays]
MFLTPIYFDHLYLSNSILIFNCCAVVIRDEMDHHISIIYLINMHIVQQIFDNKLCMRYLVQQFRDNKATHKPYPYDGWNKEWIALLRDTLPYQQLTDWQQSMTPQTMDKKAVMVFLGGTYICMHTLFTMRITKP